MLRFHPRLAPIKAAVFPLVKKDGMPEIGRALADTLRDDGLTVFYDEKGSIGKRYRRMDEAGTPVCVTIDSDTLTDGTVTVRERDTLAQTRVARERVGEFVRDQIKTWTRPM